MSLIKSISGIRGTIGGRSGDGLGGVDIVRFTAAYAEFIKRSSEGRARKIVVGRDARLSGKMVDKLVCGTLMAMGLDVVNIGLASTPTTEIAVTCEGADGGIIITASHNPTQWNALKLLNSKGEFLNDAEGKQVIEIAEAEDFTFADVMELGTEYANETYDERHIEMVLALPLVDREAIRKAGLTVAVDAVNSVGGRIIPRLLRALGVKNIIELNCEANGRFAHTPEPIPENLSGIAEVMRTSDADCGVVVDPDVDRLALVMENGEMFVEEYTLVAVADYVLSHTPGFHGIQPQFITRIARCHPRAWLRLQCCGCRRGECGGKDEGDRCSDRRRRQWRCDISGTSLRPRRAGGSGPVPYSSGQIGQENDRTQGRVSAVCHSQE